MITEDEFLNAAGNGSLNIVKEYLSKKNANIEVRSEEDDWTALMTASYYGKLSVTKYLIDMGAEIEACNHNGYNSLLLASHRCYLDVVEYLLDKGAKIEACNHKGETALILASIAPYTLKLDLVICSSLNEFFSYYSF